MSKKIEVLQNGYNDCGASCLLSILRYYGRDASHEELTLLLKTNNNGTSAYNIIEGSKEYGINGYGCRYSFEEIISNKVVLPIIVHVIKNNLYHFIVIYDINVHKKTLKVMDPEFGIKYISFEYFKSIYQGVSIILYPVKSIEKVSKKNLINYIFDYMKICKKLIIKIVIMSVLVVVLSLLSNYILKVIVDRLLVNYKYLNLIYMSLVFLSIMVTKSLISYIRNSYLIMVNNNMSVRMFSETIIHVFNLPYTFFKNKSTGEVISRINDLKEFKDILSNIMVNVFVNIILILCSMLLLININIKMFVVVLISMICYFLIVVIYSKKIRNSIDDMNDCNGKYNKVLTEGIEGYETNKNIDVIDYVINKINVYFIKYCYRSKMLENTINNSTLLKDIVMCISYILVVSLGVVLINNNIISLGDFLLFNSIMFYFIEPIENIFDLEPNISYIRSIYNRIEDLLMFKVNTSPEVKNKLYGDISINNLGYSYNDYNQVINNINIKIKFGSKFLLYGSSGSGKSTILKILLKYINNYKGNIFIDNYNIKDICNNVISSSFTYISQNNYLNNDTLKNNIIYGRKISKEKYEEIINICHVNKIRDDKVLRDDFIIEDNGFNISGGERQKIILARSLLKDSNYLIFDESLSEVGFEEEKEILNKIINYCKDKTIIYVSHKKEIIELFSDKYYLERSALCYQKMNCVKQEAELSGQL